MVRWEFTCGWFVQTGPGGIPGRWVVETGNVLVQVGGSASHLPLTGQVMVHGY